MTVSKPIFSAIARASSVVPAFAHSDLNFLNSSVFLIFTETMISGYCNEASAKYSVRSCCINFYFRIRTGNHEIDFTAS